MSLNHKLDSHAVSGDVGPAGMERVGRVDHDPNSHLSTSSNRSFWMLLNTHCSSKFRLWSRSEMGGKGGLFPRN